MTMGITESSVFIHSTVSVTLTVWISLVYPFWLLSDGLIIFVDTILHKEK